MGDAARLLGVTKAPHISTCRIGTLVCDIVGGRKMVEYNSATAYQKVRKRGRRPAADVGRKFTLMSADHEVAHVHLIRRVSFPSKSPRSSMRNECRLAHARALLLR